MGAAIFLQTLIPASELPGWRMHAVLTVSLFFREFFSFKRSVLPTVVAIRIPLIMISVFTMFKTNGEQITCPRQE